ncbi:hypothetical protein AB3Y40_07660 [Yoonia sp. R2331]|uniref:hypothetical protein n=1 Tax=Yoonia sp. R2331 TaxID=3237238 RepID=UPI0034E4A81B
MSIYGTTFSTVAGALGRTMRNFGAASRPDDAFDRYDPVPLKREELSQLFELPTGMPLSTNEEFQESERQELESMLLIRSALYASD